MNSIFPLITLLEISLNIHSGAGGSGKPQIEGDNQPLRNWFIVLLVFYLVLLP